MLADQPPGGVGVPTSHDQKYIKVNAPVDIEIADLVATLSEFPGVLRKNSIPVQAARGTSW